MADQVLIKLVEHETGIASELTMEKSPGEPLTLVELVAIRMTNEIARLIQEEQAQMAKRADDGNATTH